MKDLISKTVFYHIYPLGMCNAPVRNDFNSPAGNALCRLESQLDYIASLGVNALYIGPLFESTSHGYDTVDYYHVDRRLGNNEELASFVRTCHQKGIRVVLDAVFNHTGRDFFAFKDIQQNGAASHYKNWYQNVQFNHKSVFGDNFSYEGWADCYDLVKLNLRDSEVRTHLLDAARMWIREFDIDGLRLDAADVLAPDFMDELSAVCNTAKNGFWLMGEVVHGDYNNWAKSGRLDSVTNYELYKGLWSSFNDGNFFELAYSLNRQFAEGGLYTYRPLYTFLDNHDVNRIACIVNEPVWLYPLYGLLFSVPGIPSIYYGSEYAIRGIRTQSSDSQLRPSTPPFVSSLPGYAQPVINNCTLPAEIRRFAAIRAAHTALQSGSYRQVAVSARQFAFMREDSNEQILIAVNSSLQEASLSIPEAFPDRIWEDVLNGSTFTSRQLSKISIPSSWLRILVKKN